MEDFFCCVFHSIQVLATGLSALYSDLPTTCSYSVDEWQSPLPVIEACVPELSRFYQALEFCNSVLQVNHITRLCFYIMALFSLSLSLSPSLPHSFPSFLSFPSLPLSFSFPLLLQMSPKVICDRIIVLTREGFLQQVVGPALFQVRF